MHLLYYFPPASVVLELIFVSVQTSTLGHSKILCFPSWTQAYLHAGGRSISIISLQDWQLFKSLFAWYNHKKLHKSMFKLDPSFLSCKNNTSVSQLDSTADTVSRWLLLSLSVCKNNRKIMEEYGIMEVLELTVTRCGRWTGNREFIWSGLM